MLFSCVQIADDAAFVRICYVVIIAELGNYLHIQVGVLRELMGISFLKKYVF
jgi:hypothetical protein